jgi:hypothetical protein
MYRLNSIVKIFLFVFIIHIVNLYSVSFVKAVEDSNTSTTQTTQSQTTTESQAQTTTESQAQTTPVTQAQTTSETQAQPTPTEQPQTQPTPVTQTQPTPVTQSQTQPTSATQTQPTPTEQPQPQSKKTTIKKSSKELRKEKTLDSKRIVPYKLRSDLVLQDYTYFQFNLTFDFFSKFYKTTFSYDTQINQLNKAKQRSSFNLLEMNQNYILGYFNQKLGLSFEFNFGQGTHYSKTINDKEVTNANTNAAIYSSYATFNIKHDLFYLTKNQAFIFFYKLGIGLGYNYVSAEALTVPDLYMTGGFGVTYRISKHFDTAIGYNIGSTAYSKRYTDEYSSFKQTLIESTIYVGIVYKFYTDN